MFSDHHQSQVGMLLIPIYSIDIYFATFGWILGTALWSRGLGLRGLLGGKPKLTSTVLLT